MSDETVETVEIAGIKMSKGAAYRCMDSVEPAVTDVVKHLVKSGVEKPVVIEAAKTTAEAVVAGMIFMVCGPGQPIHSKPSPCLTPEGKFDMPSQAQEPEQYIHQQ